MGRVASDKCGCDTGTEFDISASQKTLFPEESIKVKTTTKELQYHVHDDKDSIDRWNEKVETCKKQAGIWHCDYAAIWMPAS